MTLSYIPSDTNDEGIFKATASGVLPNGKPVFVNADGTVSVAGGASQSIGSTVNFNAGITDTPSSVYDANAGKIVIAYRDESNSDYIVAIVGTLSGSSISFGTEVVVDSVPVNANNPIVYDANAQKVVVFYYTSTGNSQKAKVGTINGTSISFGSSTQVTTNRPESSSATYDANAQKVVYFFVDAGGFQNGGYPTAIVGTVSGTTISFGNSTAAKNAGSNYLAITYDSNAQKVVACWQDNGNSNYGTAAVGTLSGTSISFGTLVVLQSAEIENTTATFDSVNNKVVVAYRNSSASGRGTAIVGTVSGTNISFGTAVQFNLGVTRFTFAIFDSVSGKVVITYQDYGNSTYGTVIIATVSGTSISFGTPVVFEAASTQTPSLAYDSSNGKVVISYRGSSNYGRSVVLQVAYTNLTAENYIGISTGGTYASGSNATVKIIGNTSNEQSSLTAGQSYFVQTNGTIGTTAGDPSVFAGTAISATRLIVKT